MLTGLLNTIELDIDSPDLVVESDQAVSLMTDEDLLNTRTTATATLMNASSAVLRWRPRSRDIRAEDSVYYAQLNHLFTPTAGIIEGLHEVRVRPAQGQVRTLSIQVPGSLTITDVVAEQMQGWRFDPDTRQLDLHFDPGFGQPFAFHVYSQVAARPLPYEQAIAPITLRMLLGRLVFWVATGAEVQLGDVKAELLSPIGKFSLHPWSIRLNITASRLITPYFSLFRQRCQSLTLCITGQSRCASGHSRDAL